MSADDKLQRMLAKQKEREEAQKKKEAEKQAQQLQAKTQQNAAYMATKAPTQQKVEELPTDNWFTMKKNLYAPLPVATRGKPTLLGGDPAGENILFCIGNSVIIRNLENPMLGDIYSEHSCQTTVARYSPDRKFIASGDQSGTIRIWNTEIIQGTKFKLRIEKKALGGAITDIDWDPESKRILAVGQGREKFGVLFFAENGASAGEITGHSKTITCAAYRPAKPYRLVTGGEDFIVNWFEGPPYKFKHSLKNFTNFVNQVNFSPDGKLFLVVGQDKKGYFGDGDSGEIKYELDPANAHTGGIYGCSWSPDGTRVLTCSGDKTAKIWDASSGKCIDTFTFGNAVEDQLLGCLWQGKFRIVMNLAGHLIYLPESSSQPPLRVIKGHNKSIEALAYDPANQTVYSGSYDAIITRLNEKTGEITALEGKGHTNSIKRMLIQNNHLVTVALDDTLRKTPLSSLEFGPNSIHLGGPAAGVGVGHGDKNLIVAASTNTLSLIRNDNVVGKKDVGSLNASALALSIDDTQVALGAEDNKIHLYKISGNNFVDDGVLENHRAPITRLDYSPDGKWLVSADRNRQIVVWDLAAKKEKITEWVFHTARVDALAFSPDSLHVASGGLDQMIIVWSVENPANRVTIKAAHQGSINEVLWLDNTSLVSSGQDCTIRTWKVL